MLLIDEHVDERGKETYVAGRDEVVERWVRGGSTFHVIKNFVDPAELELRLCRLGLDCAIRRGKKTSGRETNRKGPSNQGLLGPNGIPGDSPSSDHVISAAREPLPAGRSAMGRNSGLGPPRLPCTS